MLNIELISRRDGQFTHFVINKGYICTCIMRDDGLLIQINAMHLLKMPSCRRFCELESLLGNAGLNTFIHTCDISIYF